MQCHILWVTLVALSPTITLLAQAVRRRPDHCSDTLSLTLGPHHTYDSFYRKISPARLIFSVPDFKWSWFSLSFWELWHSGVYFLRLIKYENLMCTVCMTNFQFNYLITLYFHSDYQLYHFDLTLLNNFKAIKNRVILTQLNFFLCYYRFLHIFI